jgi:predicted ABC-type sugar transport system permease subunit
VALALLGWFVFRRSSLGEQVFALGNDESAARAHGVPVTRAKVLAYVLSGSAPPSRAVRRRDDDVRRRDHRQPVRAHVHRAVVIGGISFFGGAAAPSAPSSAPSSWA